MLDRSRKIRLLIAEDVDDNYLLISTLLKNDDVELFRAVNGIDVVEMTRSDRYDIIFMDLKMPGCNGLEATKIIRGFDKEIPIIAVTAFDYGQLRDEALAVGCDDFIYKPYNMQAIRAIVRKFVNR